MTAALRTAGLALGYGGRPALEGLDLAFARGSLTAVVGPNGAGKSTLLKGLAGVLAPLAGRVERQGRIAYLPQQAELDRSFPIRLKDFVAMGLWAEIGAFGAIDRGRRARVEAALAAVGLAGQGRQVIGTLSGGQLQRALFARLLLQDADVILLDEPFAAVDERTTADLMAILHRWHGEGRTVLAVLHDLAAVRRAFPQVLLLAGGALAQGPTGTVLTEPVLHRARLAAAPLTGEPFAAESFPSECACGLPPQAAPAGALQAAAAGDPRAA